LTTGDDTIQLYSGWQCIEEREFDALDEEWQPRRQFIYRPRYIDDLVIFENYDTAEEEWVSYYYVAKANYTIATLTDDTNEPVERYLYDAYGVPSFNDGARQPVAERTTANPYLFQGRRFDTQTGLYYYRNRYYSPDLGRFMQRDPLGYVDGMGLYEFVGGRPIALLDAFGLSWSDSVRRNASVAGAAVGGAASSVADSVVSMGQTYYKLGGEAGAAFGAWDAPDITWQEIYERGPLGQAEGTWAETPTKASLGVATAATAAAGGFLVIDIAGLSSLGSMSISQALATGSCPVVASSASPRVQAAIQQAHSTLAKAVSSGSHQHHVWARYLGGPANGPLVNIDAKLHAAYHAGLDKIFSRFAGSQAFNASSKIEKANVLNDFVTYTAKFDCEFCTKLLPKLLSLLQSGAR